MRRALRGGSLCAIAAALLAPTTLASAQQAPQINAVAGFRDHLKVGAWAPVRVVVNNAQGASATGELVLPPQPASGFGACRLPIDLPPSSRRAFTLYLHCVEPASPLRVELRLKDGRLVTADVPCSPHSRGSRLVVALSRMAGGLSYINGVPLRSGTTADALSASPDAVVAYVTPDAATGALGLPDHPAGYSGVSAVVLRDLSPASFQPKEQEALVKWVESGGLLVILAAPNVSEMRDSFLEELAPVELRGQRVVPTLAALGRRFSAPVPPGQALVADVEVKPGAEAVVREQRVPLLVRWQFRNGIVWFCAADSAANPLRSADRLLLEMWTDILGDDPEGLSTLVAARAGGADLSLVSDDTVRLPVADWDAFAVLGGFLLVYIALLVPLNRLVLRRLDRREWTGLAMLLFIALFSGGAYYVGRSVRLASSHLYEAAVARLRSGSPTASVDAVIGVRSPSNQTYRLACSDGGRSIECLSASRRAPPPPVDVLDGFSIPAAAIDLWGLGAFRVAGSLDLGGKIIAQLATVDGRNLAVIIENRSPWPLRRAFVMTSSTVHATEDIPAKSPPRQCGPIPQEELQASLNPSAVHPAISVLLHHCQAVDKRGAPLDQRLRQRLLTPIVGSVATPQGGMSAFFGSGYTPPPRPGPPGPPAPPVFGAWIDLPTPLVDVTPVPGSRTSQVLLLVEVPTDVTLPLNGSLEFGPLYPEAQWGSAGLETDWEGKLVLRSGSHELGFRLPPPLGRRRAAQLAVSLSTEAHAPPGPADASGQRGLAASVWSFRRGLWEPLDVKSGGIAVTVLQPPNDYVRWPEGRMRVRVANRGQQAVRLTVTVTGAFGPS